MVTKGANPETDIEPIMLFALAALIGSVWTSTLMAALASASTVALIAVLFALPVAVGGLMEPHAHSQLERAKLFTGWVIARDRIVAVDIEQQGRRLCRPPITMSSALRG